MTRKFALIAAGAVAVVSVAGVAIASPLDQIAGVQLKPNHEIVQPKPYDRSAEPNHEIVQPKPYDRSADRRSRAASLPSREPLSEFAVLRRPRRDGDKLPEKWRPRSALDVPRMTDSRLAAMSSLGAVYAVPTDRELCVESTYLRAEDANPAETCAPTDEAAARGVVVVMQCTDGTHPNSQYVSGLIGDGVSTVRALASNAEVARAAVADNAFQLEVSEPADTLEFGDSGRRIPLPSASC